MALPNIADVNDEPRRTEEQPAGAMGAPPEYAVVLLRDGRVVEPAPPVPARPARTWPRAAALMLAGVAVVLWHAVADDPAPRGDAAASVGAVAIAAEPSIRAAPADPVSSPTPADDGSIEVCGLGRLSAAQREDDEALEKLARLPTERAIDLTVAALMTDGSERSRAAAASLKMMRSLQAAAKPQACESPSCPPVTVPTSWSHEAQDELARIASASADPNVYALALGACQSPFRAAGGACQLLSARRWAQIEPDNASAWLRVADDAAGLKDMAAFDEAIYRASKARRAELHLGLPATLALAHTPQNTSPVVTLSVVGSLLGLEMAAGVPGYSHLTRRCDGAALKEPNRRQVCDDLAELLVERSSSLIDRLIGLSLGRKLEWPADRIAAIEEERDALFAVSSPPSMASAEQGVPMTCAAVAADLERLRDIGVHGELGALRRAIDRSGVDRATLAARHRQSMATEGRAAAASAAASAASGTP